MAKRKASNIEITGQGAVESEELTLVPVEQVFVKLEDFQDGVAIGRDLRTICHDLRENQVEQRNNKLEIERIEALKSPYLTALSELAAEEKRFREEARAEGQYLAEAYKDPETGISISLRSTTSYIVEDEELVIKSLKPSEKKLVVETKIKKTALNTVAKTRSIPGVRTEIRETVVISGLDK